MKNKHLTPEESAKASVKADTRAFLSQIACATRTVRHAPNLDEIVAYGFPFDWHIEYEGKRQEIKTFLEYAVNKNLLVNTDGRYSTTSKGRSASEIGYVSSD